MDLRHLMPELALVVLGAVLLLVESFGTRKDRRGLMAILAVSGASVAAALSGYSGINGGEFLNGFILQDGAAAFSRVIFCGILAVVAILLHDFSGVKKVKYGEMFAILAFATIGLMQMTGSGDILGIYLGLELVSISSYLLAGLMKGSQLSLESAMKYFLMGAFASAVLLFGISIIYGLTGQTNLVGMGKAMGTVLYQGEYWTLALIGMALTMAGFLFKVAAAPFHMWAPDTYQGAPTPITAFLSVGPKAAAFIALLRVLNVSLPGLRDEWAVLLGGAAVLTMFVGNLSALHQKDVKRLLAYSSIAQAGYILAAFAAKPGDSVFAVLMYVTVYAIMNLGAFGVVTFVELSRGTTDVRGFNGLYRTSPWMAGAMVLFLISLIGIPPTGGMFAKFFVIAGLVRADMWWLAVAVVLNTAISVSYYYGIIKAMYLREPGVDEADPTMLASAAIGDSYAEVAAVSEHAASWDGLRIVVALAAVGVLIFGIFPQPIIDAVRTATMVVFG